MNIAILQGRPTREPVIQKSPKGKTYVKMRFAADRPYRGKNAPRESDFFNIVFFGKLAQVCYNNVAKGALITVFGRLESSKYIDAIGNEREPVSVIAEKLTIHEFLRKSKPLELDAGFDDELLVPREITGSLFKQLDVSGDDEDIPDDLLGGNIDENDPLQI